MADSLTPEEKKAIIDGLRAGVYKTNVPSTGDITILPIQPTLTPKSQADFFNFSQFLASNGHPNPNLYVTVRRQDFLELLRYADDRYCLILQNCFGFSSSLASDPNGQIQLINKGNFHQIFNRPDDDFFDPEKNTVYRNGSGNLEYFANMNFYQPIYPGDGDIYVGYFRDLYRPRLDDFIFGYLLPVKALINILSDAQYSFHSADIITFRWGLTKYKPGEDLGNFTLVIGTNVSLSGTTIEFRFEGIIGRVRTPMFTGEGGILCPPNSGCPKPIQQ